MAKLPLLKPFSLLTLQKHNFTLNPVILDAGCGNHFPSIIKQWLPLCTYHGIDRDRDNLDQADKLACDAFFEADLEISDLSFTKNNFYDGIILSHVLEHITNGEALIKQLYEKLKPGGFIYIEVPSERSLRLPSGIGTLNFYDDPTHVRFYSRAEIFCILEENNFEVIKAGVRRNWIKAIFSPLFYAPLQLKTLIKYRCLNARGLWDLLGFAEYVLAKK